MAAALSATTSQTALARGLRRAQEEAARACHHWQGQPDCDPGAALRAAPAPGGPGVGIRLPGVPLPDLRQGRAAAGRLAG